MVAHERALLFILLLLLGSFCATAQSDAPNVVLLSVDTLRADRLGCYGCEVPTSPNIDRLAAGSLLFEDCVCEVPLTGPSFASMHTSRNPRSVGATRNGMAIRADVFTIAQRFRADGYHTFCVQSNWTLKSHLSGLHRGFDVYEEAFHKKRWGVLKSERYADEVTEAALRLLEARNKRRPFFAWIHYSDPHAPYDRHKDFWPWGTARPKGREQRVRANYDSEVAFSDHHIGRLLEALPKENTAILFVADHGESLFEHDYLGHGRRLFQPSLHIPLMVRAPDLSPGRSQAPARGIDVGPTLLGLAGIDKMPGMLGLDLIAEPPNAARIRVVETYGGAVLHAPGVKQLMTDAGPIKQSVFSGEWKLITSGWRAALYDLKADPAELDDQAPAMPARVEELRAHIEGWNSETETANAKTQDLDKDDLEALESLGYLE